MARVLSNTNIVAALSDGIVLRIGAFRRGYAAAAPAVTRSMEEKAAGMVKKKRDVAAVDSDSSSWVPDPVTGYYRPANQLGEIDAAEMREMLLSQTSRGH